MEEKLGRYDGDLCPNCGHPRRQGELCSRCHVHVARIGIGAAAESRLTRARLQISLQRHPHVCCIPADGKGHCIHCDTGYFCPGCGHDGMQTIGPDQKETKLPGHFLLRCPKCGSKKWIHWIEYDLTCPRCGNKYAFGTYTKSLERIIQCPDCGVMPRGEAA